MKTRILAVLLALLCFFCAFVLVACDDEQGAGPHTHEWGMWRTMTAATCREKGMEKRECACGEVETREVDINANSHVYNEKNTCTLCGHVQEYTEGLFYRSINDGEAYKVMGIGNAKAHIIIPHLHKGKPVTAIDSEAFYDCDTLISVQLPEGMTTIGEQAFYDCNNLTSITLPDSIVDIGYQAFYNCNNLIQIDKGIHYVGKWVIDCDDVVTNVVLRNDTVGIIFHAFSFCENLLSITIPASVKYIDGFAVAGCDSLASVVFEQKEGWKVSTYNFETTISKDDLFSASIAATYLKETYNIYEWERS